MASRGPPQLLHLLHRLALRPPSRSPSAFSPPSRPTFESPSPLAPSPFLPRSPTTSCSTQSAHIRVSFASRAFSFFASLANDILLHPVGPHSSLLRLSRLLLFCLARQRHPAPPNRPTFESPSPLAPSPFLPRSPTTSCSTQ